MAEQHDEWDVRPEGGFRAQSASASTESAPAEHPLPEIPAADPGTLRVGFVGLPNSGKTSYIHAIRNSAASSGRGHGRWDFGGVLADSGDVFRDPDQTLQEATEAGYFEKAPFCRVTRAMLRLGSWTIGPTRTLVLPEVSGETLRAIAKGRRHTANLLNADNYLGFLSQSDRILCFVSIDGSKSSVGGVVGLDPGRAIADQLPVISRVLEAADEHRTQESRYAVSVLLTKVDLLRERPEFDRVSVPRDRSAVARLARGPRGKELEQRLQEQGSDERHVRFSVWTLMRSSCAEGDLDVQEALAADFLRCHAPKAAEHMEHLQNSGGRRRSVRFFLTAPYGNSFITARGEQRKPDPSELQSVMLFEPLESALERCWVMHRGDRIRRRLRAVAVTLAVILLLGPLLTIFLERWVESGLRVDADAASAGKAATVADLELRRDLLAWCPQVLLLQHSELARGLYGPTAFRVADIYRQVADRLESDAGDASRHEEARAIRAQASILHPNASDHVAQVRQVWRWLEGKDSAPDSLHPETVRLLNQEFEASVAGWNPGDRADRLRRLEAKARASGDSDRVDELLRRILRAQDREGYESASDPRRLLATNADGSPHQPSAERLATLDLDAWNRAQDASGANAAGFRNPRDLQAWSTTDSWEAVARNRVARDRLLRWTRDQAEGLRFQINALSGQDGSPPTAEVLDRLGAMVGAFLVESDPKLMPKWYPTWPIDLSEPRERLREVSAAFRLLDGIRSDAAGVVMRQDPTLDLCIRGKVPTGTLRIDQGEIPLGTLWKSLAAEVKRELMQRVVRMSVSDPKIPRHLRDRYPDDQDISRIERLASIAGGLRRQIDANEPLPKVIGIAEQILGEDALKDRVMREQLGLQMVEALLEKADLVQQIGKLSGSEAARLNILLQKTGQADVFANRYLLKSIARARDEAKSGNKALVEGALLNATEFGSDAAGGSWRSRMQGYTAELRRRLEQPPSAAGLAADLNPDLMVLDQLGASNGQRLAGPGPADLAKVLRAHLDRVDRFKLLRVAGPGANAPALWIGKYELSRDEAERLRILLGKPPVMPPRFPTSFLAHSPAETIQLVDLKRLDDLGVRLPTLDELSKADQRRKARPRRIPEAQRGEFREPASLETLDQTEEGLVGLSLGAGEVCAKGEALEGEPNFPRCFGIRLAMDLLPKELREP